MKKMYQYKEVISMVLNYFKDKNSKYFLIIGKFIILKNVLK